MVLSLVASGEWTLARQGALGFKSKNDQVRLDFPDHHTSLTLGAWINLNSVVISISHYFF